MRPDLLSFRGLAWLALAFGLLAAPAPAHANQTVYADFDGDGQRDHATVNASGSVRVWLSSTQTSRVLPTKRRLQQLATGDLDGDGRLELIGVDDSADLLVWKTHHRKKFKRYHAAKRPVSRSHPSPTSGLDDDHGTPDAADTSRGGPTPIEAPTSLVGVSPRLRAAARPSDEREAAAYHSSRSAPRAPPSVS